MNFYPSDIKLGGPLDRLEQGQDLSVLPSTEFPEEPQIFPNTAIERPISCNEAE